MSLSKKTTGQDAPKETPAQRLAREMWNKFKG